MIAAFVLGASSTVAIYKGFRYVFPEKKEESFDDFLRFQDVRSTLITVEKSLKKNPEYEQLRSQHKLIKRYLNDVDQLIDWRKKKTVRYLAYTGEKSLIRKLREEWLIFKVRIRVIQGLNYLQFYN